MKPRITINNNKKKQIKQKPWFLSIVCSALLTTVSVGNSNREPFLKYLKYSMPMSKQTLGKELGSSSCLVGNLERGDQIQE